MAFLSYNGVTLALMRTIEFSVEAEYDSSHTDVLWFKNTIRAQGILSDPSGNPLLPSDVNIAALKHMLETPRAPILYAMNGGTVIFTTAGLDVASGPEPLPMVVRQVTSSAIIVEVGYVVRIRDCATGSPSPVVSLRWESSESFDQNWYSRLRTSGKLIVRTDLGQSADSFRALATPTVEKDYERLSSDYVLSPSGTELAFTFVDREVYLLPPRPATKASGRCTVSVQKGGKRFGQVDVHLEGPKGVSRKDLMAVAIRMCWSKLQAEGLFAALAEGKFSESLFEGVVDVSMSGMLLPLAAPVAAAAPAGGGLAAALLNPAGLLGPLGLIGPLAGGGAGGAVAAAVPANTPAVMASAGVTPWVSSGSAGLAPPVRRRISALLVAMFRDPCVAASIGSGGTGELASVAGPGNPMLKSAKGFAEDAGTFTLNVGVLPAGPVGLAFKDLAPYDHYIVESNFRFDTGLRGMPGTGVGAGGGNPALVEIHGGMMKLVVDWSAGRSGVPPVLPAAESTDPNFVLIDEPVIQVQAPEIGADGSSEIFTVTGRYTYLCMNPSQVSVLAPIPPFLSDTAAQGAQLAAGYYSSDVLFKFRGASGQNPFVRPVSGGQPNANLAVQMGINAASGGSVAATNSAAIGGLDTGGGQGGGVLPRPKVNA
jgi:hypothetical protein